MIIHLLLFFSRVEFIQLALETKPLNLGQGFPDDLIPDYVPKSLSEVAQDSILNNQYTRGFVSVHEASEWMRNDPTILFRAIPA